MRHSILQAQCSRALRAIAGFTRGPIQTSLTPQAAPRRDAGRWGRLSGGLPELAELLAKLLARRGPVCADGFAQLGHVAFDVEFVFLEPGDVEFLAGGAAFELAGDVGFVVADDSGETTESALVR